MCIVGDDIARTDGNLFGADRFKIERKRVALGKGEKVYRELSYNTKCSRILLKRCLVTGLSRITHCQADLKVSDWLGRKPLVFHTVYL